tara:strand:- start:8041 stop:8235 length:195 start_codon:yes stop_codon:yes gene_type:complete
MPLHTELSHERKIMWVEMRQAWNLFTEDYRQDSLPVIKETHGLVYTMLTNAPGKDIIDYYELHK